MQNISNIPTSWKESAIILLRKGGNPQLIHNYRPIALLSTFYKLYSHILHKHLLNQANFHKIIAPEQLGFMPGRSTIENVTTLISIIELNSGHKSPLYIAFCDFMKAFDSISNIAISKRIKSRS
jgi:hypothetical protein